MALTSYPTILFNSTVGNNDLASGAGPSDPIIGTATATTSTSVTLTITSGSLTNVAQNGSAVLYMSGIGFARIGSHDGSTTLTVEPVLSGSAVPFAIGGKRATLDHLDSRKLFLNYSHPTSGNIAGAGNQWNIYGEDSSVFTLTSGLTFNIAMTGNSPGDITVWGASGISRLVWLQTTGQPHIHLSGAGNLTFKNIDFQCSGGTPKAVFLASAATLLTLDNCSIGNSGGINKPTSIYARNSASLPYFFANDSSFIGLASGVTNNTASSLITFTLRNCEFSKCATDVLLGFSTTPINVYKCLFAHNSGHVFSSSVASRDSIIINDCTFDNNRGAALRTNISQMRESNMVITNSQFTNNIWGIWCTAVTSGLGPQKGLIQNCNWYNNASGNVTGTNIFTLNNSNTFVDPQYIDASRDVRNYGVGTVMRQLGYVTGFVGNADNQTRSYGVIGVAQRNETGGSVGGGESSYVFG